MSEYPIGLNGEMIDCLAQDDYSRFCRSKLERELKERVENFLWRFFNDKY